MIQNLISEVRALRGRLKRGRAVNVNDQTSKDTAISLASIYFESVRPTISSLNLAAHVEAHDSRWQNLVRLAHGNNKRATYLSTLSKLEKELKEFSVAHLARTIDTGSPTAPSDLTHDERLLIETLEQLLPTAAASYRQGITDLNPNSDRLSFRGTVAEFREALRETLDHLAPDQDVHTQAGFKLEPNQNRPTMKQKAAFVMKSRGRSASQRTSTEKAVRGIEDLVGEMMRATYDRASLATHLETTRAEVLRIKRYVDTVLFDLLEIKES